MNNREDQTFSGRPEKENLEILFIHPDLGIGGAERLVVDAALALKQKGHKVHFLTCHHDPAHCFPETINGALDITVVGDWLPRSFLGKFYAFWAYFRMIVACIYFLWPFRQNCSLPKHPDVLFIDQISACIPVIRLVRPSLPVIFYCHFPDLLLASHGSVLRKFYRFPLDALEQWSTGLASVILVNSHFTAGVFRDTFKSLAGKDVDILYPTLNTKPFQGPSPSLPPDFLPARAKNILLSINRYERKKNVALAIKAFAVLRGRIPPGLWNETHLVIAGGYDTRVPENVDYFDEIAFLADRLEVATSVTFLRSPTDDTKRALIEKCRVLIYTPDREHFGIVPLEAMYCRRPVIAVNSGGPLETVKDGISGKLCEPKAENFAAAMGYFLQNPAKVEEYGDEGRKSVIDNFIFDSFANKLHSICQNASV